MTQQNFPFGNDPRKVNDWLWMADTKSRNWLVAYIAGLSIGCTIFKESNLKLMPAFEQDRR